MYQQEFQTDQLYFGAISRVQYVLLFCATQIRIFRFRLTDLSFPYRVLDEHFLT